MSAVLIPDSLKQFTLREYFIIEPISGIALI